jgi:hypothetical protein
MRQAHKRIASGGSIINISLNIFIEFIMSKPNTMQISLIERNDDVCASQL